VEQLGELQRSADALRQRAEVYVLNKDTPQESMRLRTITGISFPVLLDSDLAVARRYDLLPKPGQPMGGMQGVAQMGFVVVDPQGVIRVQRADILFGQHAGQILQIVNILSQSGSGRQ